MPGTIKSVITLLSIEKIKEMGKPDINKKSKI